MTKTTRKGPAVAGRVLSTRHDALDEARHLLKVARLSFASAEETPADQLDESLGEPIEIVYVIPRPPDAQPDETTAAEDWLDSLDPASTPADDPRELRRVGLAQRGVEEAEAELRASVREARAAGRTWADIGRTLGVTRQAAQIRFRESALPTA
jgi:hypothetical protein